MLPQLQRKKKGLPLYYKGKVAFISFSELIDVIFNLRNTLFFMHF